MTQATVGSRINAMRSPNNLKQQLSRFMPLVVLAALGIDQLVARLRPAAATSEQ